MRWKEAPRFMRRFGMPLAVVAEDEDIPLAARGVYCIIAVNTNSETGISTLSVPRIAALAGVSKRQALRHLGALQDAGVIKRVSDKGMTAVWKVSIRGHFVSKPRSRVVTNMSPEGVTRSGGGMTWVSPEPVTPMSHYTKKTSGEILTGGDQGPPENLIKPQNLRPTETDIMSIENEISRLESLGDRLSKRGAERLRKEAAKLREARSA